MSTSAILLMILVQGSVTVIAAYFLIKVLRIPPKTDSEDTSESNNESD